MKYAWWVIVGLVLFLLCTQQASAAEISGFDPTADYIIHSKPLIVNDNPIVIPAVASTPEAGSEGKQTQQEYSLAESSKNNSNTDSDLSELTYSVQQEKAESNFLESLKQKTSSFFGKIKSFIGSSFSNFTHSFRDFTFKSVLAMSMAINKVVGNLSPFVNRYISFLREHALGFALLTVAGPGFALFASTPLGKAALIGLARFIAAGTVSAIDLVLHAGSYIFGVLNSFRIGTPIWQGYQTSKEFIRKKTGHDIGDFNIDVQVVAVRVVVAVMLLLTPLLISTGVEAVTAIGASTTPELVLRSNVALQKTAMDCNMPGQCDTPTNLGITAGSNFLFGVAPVGKGMQLIDDEAKAVGKVLPKLIKSPLTEEEIEVISTKIASGHAFEKHLIGDNSFPFLKSKDDLRLFVKKVMSNPDDVKIGADGRVAFWDDASQTITIYDPNHIDLGTSFKPSEDLGKKYFSEKFN